MYYRLLSGVTEYDIMEHYMNLFTIWVPLSQSNNAHVHLHCQHFLYKVSHNNRCKGIQVKLLKGLVNENVLEMKIILKQTNLIWNGQLYHSK